MISSICQRQVHGNITLQYPVTHSHFLDGRLPVSCLLLLHWSIIRKLDSVETGLVDEAVAVTVKTVQVKGTYETQGTYVEVKVK